MHLIIFMAMSVHVCIYVCWLFVKLDTKSDFDELAVLHKTLFLHLM